MALIPDTVVADILSKVDIVELIGEVVDLKRAGREYKGCSPFTNEKTPSFFVNPDKQLFFDFSSGKNGNAIVFIEQYKQLPFRDAVEELATRVGVDLKPILRPGAAVDDAAMKRRRQLLGAMEHVAVLYRTLLSEQGPQDREDARNYAMKKRQLSQATLVEFEIGYAPDQWQIVAGSKVPKDRLIECGLLKESTKSPGRHYDHFRARLMFPIRNEYGELVGFGGRTMGDIKPKYLNSPQTPIFDKSKVLYGLFQAVRAARADRRQLEKLLFVEGYIDVAMMANSGLNFGVSAMGTSLSPEQVRLAFKACPNLVMCLDGDRAGKAAMERSLEVILPELKAGRTVGLLTIPDNHDPDSYIRAHSAEEFVKLIDRAEPLLDYVLRTLKADAVSSTSSVEARAALITRAVKPLSLMPETPAKQVLMTEISRIVNVPYEQIMATLAQLVQNKPQRSNDATPAAAPDSPESDPGTLIPETPARTLLPAQRNPNARASPVLRAIQLILHYDAIKVTIRDCDIIAACAPSFKGGELLLRMANAKREQPKITSIGLAELCRDEREIATVKMLTEEKPVIPTKLVTLCFVDMVNRIAERHRTDRVDELLDASVKRGLLPAELEELSTLSDSSIIDLDLPDPLDAPMAHSRAPAPSP